ncbi:MAG: hypothetical protein WC022_00330 [Parcubacteria group bacterium]
MTKWKKIALGALVMLVVALAGYKTWQKMRSGSQTEQATVSDASMILFYGEQCPHCQDVEKYIADHQLDKKVSFSKLEVWSNKANANMMAQKAQACGIKTDSLGVPFLWATGKCYIGVNEVENFLDSAAK